MAGKAKGAKGASAPLDPDIPRLSAHPRARRQIAVAKSWGGLAAFVVAAVLSRGAGLEWFDALLRGLAAGAGAYLAAWGLAVVVWDQLARGELEIMRRRAQERRREAEETLLEAARAAQEARANRDAA
jgi:uncharacterized membrane protein YccC